MDLKFTKMQAYGNDYVYIDAVSQTVEDPSALAKAVSNRHFGIGSDGLVLICPSDRGAFRMRMFNPDGTEGEMCGNALRSLSKFVYHYGMTDKTEFFIETMGGMQHVWLHVENGEVTNITADIGAPRLNAAEVPVATEKNRFVDEKVRILDKTFSMTALSWGNPHCVVYVDDADFFEVQKYGPAVENDRTLFPNRTNVTFAEVVSPDYIKIREWERGTGETIGCGTGCCSAVAASVLLGKSGRKVQVEQIGGILQVEWNEKTGHMLMTGPSHIVFEGVYHGQQD